MRGWLAGRIWMGRMMGRGNKSMGDVKRGFMSVCVCVCHEI